MIPRVELVPQCEHLSGWAFSAVGGHLWGGSLWGRRMKSLQTLLGIGDEGAALVWSGRESIYLVCSS